MGRWIAPLLLLAACARAQVTVSVNGAGQYTVSTGVPAWTFRGSTGQPATNIQQTTGRDAAGTYEEITFEYDANGRRQASIRGYSNVQVAIFTITYVDAGENTAPFPALASYPGGLMHLALAGAFAQPNFTKLTGDSPWLFFDSDANSFILSAASNFMVSEIHRDGAGAISAGISPRIPHLPAHFAESTILAAGQGIDATYRVWGNTLQQLYDKTQDAARSDITLQSIGYWTDSGSAYYYQSALPIQETLPAIRDEFRSSGIPLGYMQLDSWFYPKGPSGDWADMRGGIEEYLAAPALFPAGLGAFQSLLGLPLVTHARWIDASSPYRREFVTSGNVVLDPRYWTKIAGYLHGAGVSVYEQDWLDANAQPEFNLTAPGEFLDNMASAMAREGITMQYCMPGPRHILQSVKYPNLTTIRASLDRFNPNRWTDFLYAGRLATAVGAWPFADAFRSDETNNLLLATLSAGPLAIGDKLGKLDSANLRKAVRLDGVIVKPDIPAAPLDRIYLQDAAGSQAPMIAATFSDFGGWRARYVFVYERGAAGPVDFRPAELGIAGSAYVFNYRADSGRVYGAGDVISDAVDQWGYYVIVPLGRSGIAFLGDAGQFVPLGKQRISQVTEDGPAIEAEILFAAGEGSRKIRGYAPAAPQIAVSGGNFGAYGYDSRNGMFTAVVSAGQTRRAKIRIGLDFSQLCRNGRSTAGLCGF